MERERGQIRQQRRTESISCSAAGGVIGGERYGHWLRGTTISVHLCLSNSLSLSLYLALSTSISLSLSSFPLPNSLPISLLHLPLFISFSLSLTHTHTLCLYLLRLHDLNTSLTVDAPPHSHAMLFLHIVTHDDTNKP